MLGNPPNKARKKTAFVPRLAFGCVGLGMGVIPAAAASSGCDLDPPSVGVRIEFADASAEADAPAVGILPYIPDAAAEADAPAIGILPYVPDAAGEAED
jgi:hypothetical protein